MMEARMPAIRDMLPRHMTPERVLRLMTQSFARNPTLTECTPASLMGAFMEACALGLEIDCAGQAWLVPFRVKGRMTATLIPGYKGLVQLVYRSGLVSTIEARVVRDGDSFSYRYGSDRYLHHVRGDGNPGEALKAVYALAKMKDGNVEFEVLTPTDIAHYRAFSRTAERDDGPWKTHEEDMWKKTAVRVLVKLLPSSIEVQRLVELDEAAESGLPQNLQFGGDEEEGVDDDGQKGSAQGGDANADPGSAGAA
jgi:recombination protein RecT